MIVSCPYPGDLIAVSTVNALCKTVPCRSQPYFKMTSTVKLTQFDGPVLGQIIACIRSNSIATYAPCYVQALILTNQGLWWFSSALVEFDVISHELCEK